MKPGRRICASVHEHARSLAPMRLLAAEGGAPQGMRAPRKLARVDRDHALGACRTAANSAGTRVARATCMSHHHVAVWLDHNEARILHVTPEMFDEATIESPGAHVQLHRRSGTDDGHRAHEIPRYYDEVALALRDADEILVLGPATAKLELIKRVHSHHSDLVSRIVGVETVDHPTDRQIATYARRYFEAADRMR